MSKKTTYRQCKLQKKIEGGVKEQTSYIPEPYCHVGKVLKLRDSDGEWEDGWKVIFASKNSVAEEQVNQQSWAHMNYRQTTDI